MLDAIFERFAKKSPVSVIARGLMERVLNPEQIDKWFDQSAEQQYTRSLLFSTLFDMMSDVVCGPHKSVHSSYQATKEEINVSIASVYNKLNGIEVKTSEALVRYAAGEIKEIINNPGGARPPQLQSSGSVSKIFLINRAHVLRASLEQSELFCSGSIAAGRAATSPSAGVAEILPRLE